LPDPLVTVAIPTLAADSKLADCVRSLCAQTWRDFTVTVIDNSGQRLARSRVGACGNVRVIENERNVGFGAAVNQALASSPSRYLASLNDDTVAEPRWLEELLAPMLADKALGMCASHVRLAEDGRLDSAGMLICRDGSSKQRGHLAAPRDYDSPAEVLAPSGSAAL
jgi:GT2 family glycosyltransferase